MITSLILLLMAAILPPEGELVAVDQAKQRFDIYQTVRLRADLSDLTEAQRTMIDKLITAAEASDRIFWQQAYGNPESLLPRIASEDTRRFAAINYGPWDRLNGNKPFLKGVSEKPAGANFYPLDMSREEFEQWDDVQKTGLYSMIRRDADGSLRAIPYNQFFADDIAIMVESLRSAAELAESTAFANYLRMRAEALESNQYRLSDMSWMDVTDNRIEVVIGPIETYEDQLFGYKAAFETFILLKDMEWSERLARFADFLPGLQQGLPVSAEYKTEEPGSDADLHAYDVLYVAGDANKGAKTIAINLPNDEEVQLKKGTRRLQLKNAMRAKFDRILMPIAERLIVAEQRKHLSFDAFFANTMFHEVAHGLGIKKVVGTDRNVREALAEHASAIEEGKADVLGLYMITELHEQGAFEEGELMDYYVTFLASIFRSVRFGAASAHGRANMVRFNFFEEMGAFSRDPETGEYRVHFDQMRQASNKLANLLLVLQGDGDYEGAGKLLSGKGFVGEALAADLARLEDIPVDIVYEQGRSVLEL